MIGKTNALAGGGGGPTIPEYFTLFIGNGTNMSATVYFINQNDANAVIDIYDFTDELVTVKKDTAIIIQGVAEPSIPNSGPILNYRVSNSTLWVVCSTQLYKTSAGRGEIDLNV